MDLEKQKGRNFFSVAMAMILAGSAIFAFGSVAWIINCYTNTSVMTVPSVKIIAGLIIISLGYIILILEAIRRK